MIFGKGVIALRELVAGVIAQRQTECSSLAKPWVQHCTHGGVRKAFRKILGLVAPLECLPLSPEPYSPAPAFQLFINQCDSVLCRPSVQEAEAEGSVQGHPGLLSECEAQPELEWVGQQSVLTSPGPLGVQGHV